jgi:hypothetical protein
MLCELLLETFFLLGSRVTYRTTSTVAAIQPIVVESMPVWMGVPLSVMVQKKRNTKLLTMQ